MNVNTIGFPFASPTGAPVFGTADQGFALALGTISGFGTPKLAGAVPQGDPAKPPLLSEDGTPAPLDARALVRAQPGSPITLAQLLTAGSKLPIADVKIPPAGIPGQPETPAAAPELAAQPSVPQTIDPQTIETPVVATAPDTAHPYAAPVKADPEGPVPCGLATDELPAPLDLPTATRPTKPETLPAATATPVKARKPVATESDAPALPADPLAVQPNVTPAVPAALVAVAAPAPQPAATSDRKAENGRGKAVSAALAPTDAPIADANEALATKLPKTTDTTPNGASLSDAALPNETAARAEGRAAAPTPQSFASQVSHPTAAAPTHTPAATAPAVPAEPMVPARAGQLGHALGVEIARKVGTGEDTLRVRLNPVELGRVEVTLAFDDTGNLRATMRTESQHALDLLRQDAPDLGRALDSAGIRADTQSFRFESRGDGNSGSGGQSGQHQSRGNSQHGFKDEPETPAPAYRAIRNDGQVDLLA